MFRLLRFLIPLFPLVLATAQPTGPMEWPEPTPTARPATYWWWPASAVDPANITKQLEVFQAAGLGGVHIIPIYGAKGAESRSIPYLTPRWLEMLHHTVAEAARLGLFVDMTTGTGWCFGGPNVGPQDANAVVVPAVHEVKPGATLEFRLDPAAVPCVAAVAADGQYLDLTGRVGSDGLFSWQAGAGGPWQVFVVTQKPSPQKVKRPAPGGEGPMLNLLYGAAMPRYLERFTTAFAALPKPWPRAMYHDSYEYVSNWSPDLLAQFEKRRGYKLQGEFPAFFGTAKSERAARVLCDYRETVSDILAEESLPAWAAWCLQRGLLTRNEAHGSPGNLLDLYATADIPETEMFHRDRNKLVSKLASSAAHVTGKRLVSSETGTWLREHFTETLGDMKLLVDDLFLSGANHIFYHGCCYSPEDAAWPGWLFYASYEMNPRNPVWHDVDALNAYATRCQSVLQAGQPDHDVLLYWPIHESWQTGSPLEMKLTVHAREWFEDQPIGQAAAWLWSRGFAFDYVSDRMLATAAIDGTNLRLPGGAYRTVVVPRCQHIPLPTMEKLVALAKAGGTVIVEGDLPADVPGWGALEARRAQLRELVGSLPLAASPGGKAREARPGTGRILVGALDDCLGEAAVARETLVDTAGLQFVRRRIEGGRHYFLANQGDQTIRGWIPLAMEAKSAVVLDPMTGRRSFPGLRPEEGGRTGLRLELPPKASLVVRAFAGEEALVPPSPVWAEAGPAVAIPGEWTIQFVSGGPALPAAYRAAAPAPWSARDDEACRNFSGTAVYSARFDAPAAPATAWHLDLGEVHQSARVALNGQALGTLFVAPMRLPLPALEPKDNLLEIEVTSVAANRIRDLDRRKVAWRIFHDINFVNIDYKPFDASGWDTTPSGLAGPVRLVPMKPVMP